MVESLFLSDFGEVDLDLQRNDLRLDLDLQRNDLRLDLDLQGNEVVTNASQKLLERPRDLINF